MRPLSSAARRAPIEPAEADPMLALFGLSQPAGSFAPIWYLLVCMGRTPRRPGDFAALFTMKQYKADNVQKLCAAPQAGRLPRYNTPSLKLY